MWPSGHGKQPFRAGQVFGHKPLGVLYRSGRTHHPLPRGTGDIQTVGDLGAQLRTGFEVIEFGQGHRRIATEQRHRAI